MKLMANYLDLKGSHYTIGKEMGKYFKKENRLKYLTHDNPINKESIDSLNKYLDLNASGLREEIAGFSDITGIPMENTHFYLATYLSPRCSQIGIIKEKSKNNSPIQARNYEFHHLMEDFTLIKTSVDNKYSHIGTSQVLFGRDEGINEKGLMISMSACGIPVGADPNMKSPGTTGLQYWIGLREALENCENSKEAVSFLKDFPLATNANFLIGDINNDFYLFEIMDGDIGIKKLEDDILATNHPLIDSIIEKNPMGMENSLVRSNIIKEFLNKDIISKEDIKNLLNTKYPNGLQANYYKEVFGTTKSVIMDSNEKSIEVLFGGNTDNNWDKFYLDKDFKNHSKEIVIKEDKLKENIFKPMDIKEYMK